MLQETAIKTTTQHYPSNWGTMHWSRLASSLHQESKSNTKNNQKTWNSSQEHLQRMYVPNKYSIKTYWV